MSDPFRITATDGAARAGVLETAHGPVETPVFMPVGTKASVKAMLPAELRDIGATIVLARFMPIVRTFVPVVAGAARMSYRPFQLFNVIGGIAWVCIMLMIGYGLVRYIPVIDKNIDKVIIVIITVSLAPALTCEWRSRHTAVSAVASPHLRTTLPTD